VLVATAYEQVTQIKMSRFPVVQGGVAAYLVDALLIDSGPAHTAQELLDFLKDKSVKIVVNTHYHEDHIAANAILQERYGVGLLAHPLAISRISQKPELYPYQEEVWGYAVPSRPEPIGEYVTTDNFRFDVISTRGHSDDHICLIEKDKGWLFSGDLFYSAHPIVARPEENQWQIIESLKKIKGLKPRLLFTSPGFVISEPDAKLEQAIQYLEDLGQKVKGLSGKGLSPVQIRQQLFGDENPISETTQGQFSSENLVKTFLKEA